MAETRSLKLPTYNTNIDAWLIHVDAYIGQCGTTTDKERYGALIGALPTSVIAGVQHVLTNPPEKDKYEALKTALKKRYCREDDESNFQKILTISQGDLLPSALYEEMVALNRRRTAKLPSSVIRSMHLTKLPTQMQPIVDAVTTDKTDEEYAALADKIFKRQAQQASVCKISDEDSSNIHAIQSKSEVQQLRSEVAELRALIERNLLPRTEPAQAAKRVTSGLKNDYCRYHKTFGHDARRCQPPCSFRQQGNYKRRKVVSKISSSRTSRLLYISDASSKIRYLIDTGSAVSILPPSRRINPGSHPAYDLLADNGTPIATFGTVNTTIRLALNLQLDWPFIIADVSQPIIGMDLLKHHKFLVNTWQHSITHTPSETNIAGQPAKGSSCTVTYIQENCKLHQILDVEFPELTDARDPKLQTLHPVRHHIETTGPPVFAQPRRLSPEKLEAARTEFQEMLAQGIIRPSKSA